MTDHRLPFVSVIIPVLNGERTIRECVVSLLRMDYPPERREILVVDSSTDRTVEIATSFPVRYFWEERRGVATARNRGIGASQGEVLAFADADCVVTTGWLRELIQGFDSEEVGVVVGEVVAYPPTTLAERYVAVRKPLWQMPNISSPVSPWFHVNSTAVRRRVFNEIGLFDPQFGACEGSDFSRRFLQHENFKLSYRPKAVVFHRNRLTTGELFKQYHTYGRGMAILCRKYRREHLWDWQRELRAYSDLLLTSLALGPALIRSRLRGRETKGLSYLYCDLVRKLGARIGFICGSFRRDSTR